MHEIYHNIFDMLRLEQVLNVVEFVKYNLESNHLAYWVSEMVEMNDDQLNHDYFYEGVNDHHQHQLLHHQYQQTFHHQIHQMNHLHHHILVDLLLKNVHWIKVDLINSLL